MSDEQKADRGEVRVVFDVERGRPACALIQAAAGATPGVAGAFDADTWLVAPTPEMRMLRGSREELRALVETVERPDPEGGPGE